MSIDLMKGFEWCAVGCGRQHRIGTTDQNHDPSWLEAERVRLTSGLEKLTRTAQKVTGAVVDVTTEMLMELTEERDAMKRRAESAEGDWKVAERQRNAAFALLREETAGTLCILAERGATKITQQQLCPPGAECWWCRARALVGPAVHPAVAPPPPAPSAPYGELDPGIRDIVRRLNEAGFETTDSGDGVSKRGLMDCALPFAHVVVATTADRMLEDANRVGTWLTGVGLDGKVEATYDPGDQSAIIMVSWDPPSAWSSSEQP